MQHPGIVRKNIQSTVSHTEPPKNGVVRPVDQVEDREAMKHNSKFIYGVYGLLILLGIGTGYMLSRNSSGGLSTNGNASVVKSGNTVGSTDATTFKDSAQGVVQKGGSDGEGTHQLVRDGGPSQTVSLVSSVIDLDLYVGKKVKVWGQTMAAQKVAWLMDVGKIELLSK